jgi:dipeptidyl-peptidase-4
MEQVAGGAGILNMRKINTLPALLIALHVAVPASAQDERIDLDWVFSEEGKVAMALPREAWIGPDAVLVYGNGLPRNERTLQVLNPANGRRRDLVDAASVVREMNEILEPEEPIEELGWPDALDPTGRRAAYVRSGEILLLDLQRSSVSAVTSSDADETSPQFSPDGHWLAYVRDNDLYAWNIADGEETRLTSDGSETLRNGTLSWVYWEELFNRSDRGFTWSPDSRSIAFLQTDESGVGQMHYVDFEPYLPKLIDQRHPKPGSANPRVRAGVVSLDEARTTWIDLGAYPYEYLPRIKWLPDGIRLAVLTMNRPQTVVDIFIADIDTGESRHLLRETDEGWVNIHDDLYFLADGEHFIWRSERDGYAHLYRFDMAGRLVNRITDGDWALRESGGAPGMSQAVSFIDEDAGRIYFTALEKASTERHLYRVDMDGSGMERVTSQDGSHAIDFSPGGDYFIDSHSAIDTAPTLRVYSSDGRLVSSIAEAGSDASDRFDLLPWEMFTIRARDGFELPAMMLKPRFFDPDRQYPVVTYVYGGPSAPTVVNAWQGRDRALFHQVLAESGVIVFQVDNRSAAGKSKIDANAIVTQLYGPVELNDLLDGIAWLKAQPFVDADRVGIWGWSGGGTMTLQSMTRSDEFAAGAAVAPVSDWRFYDTIYTERYMKRPRDNEEGYEASSHVNRAADLHGRLMIVHGTYDDNVHPQNTWAFTDELIEAGITYDMMIYPMRKHGISDDAARHHVYRSMYEFWQRNFDLGD